MSGLIRLAGVVAVVGGLVISNVLTFLVLGFEDFRQTATTGVYALISLLCLLTVVLVSDGLVGLLPRQPIGGRRPSGASRLPGGLLRRHCAGGGPFWAQTFVLPAAAEAGPEFLENAGWLNIGFTLSFALTSLGWLLFGVATLRGRVYPRTTAILVLTAAISGLGFALLTGRGGAVQ